MAYPILDQNIGRTAVINHEIRIIDDSLIEELKRHADSIQIYEVIRCIDGVLLFFDDHMERMRNSVSEINNTNPFFFDSNHIKTDAEKLILSEGIQNGNIKIIMTEDVCAIFASAFYYPPESVYESGVAVGLIEWERPNPNAKLVSSEYKLAMSQKLQSDGPFGKYFETLLVARDGRVTEGSRTNVFFVEGSKVFTAPRYSILEGITRKYVLQAIEAAGCEIFTEHFSTNDIKIRADAVFLTGTSIGVLPVSAVEDFAIDSPGNSALQRIIIEYSKIVDEFIKIHKKAT
jgi:branched-chain amino acid aminotransferase